MPGYEYNKEYAKKYMGKLEEIKLRVPKGRKADIEAFAKSKNLSVNAFITLLIQNAMGLSEEDWKRSTQD